MKKRFNNGFTLVELSIVLVIIGLLIGGILVGQSLIDSARLTRLIRDLQQYDIAVSQFKAKYKALPGDSDKFEPQGNNNGKVTCSGFCLSVDFTDATEMANFWKHLSDSGFTPNGIKFSNTAANSIVPGVHVPKFDYKRAGVNGGLVVYDNIYYIAGFSTFYNSVKKFSPVFKTMDALAIDSKLDDGKPSTGNIIGTTHGASIVWAGDDCGLTEYNISSANDQICALMTPVLSLAQ